MHYFYNKRTEQWSLRFKIVCVNVIKTWLSVRHMCIGDLYRAKPCCFSLFTLEQLDGLS